MKNLLFFLAVIFSTASYSQLTDANIQTAVDLWVSDPSTATTTYGDISTWDVSQVTDMSNLFQNKTTFNGDISAWDVSNVLTMKSMFKEADSFNQDIGDWDVSNVTDMSWMFDGAKAFNQNINSWNVSSVTDMSRMFSHTTDIFNQPLGNWNVSNVTNMNNMFSLAYFFNQDISSWDVSNVTNMTNMFREAITFNQDISGWNVSNVTDMSWIFYNADAFNQDISSWDLSNVTDMQLMFYSADSFNQDVSTWDVSNVTDMTSMFDNSGVSTDNYDNILIGWSSQTLQSNVPFGADGLNYCWGANARQSLIDTYGWIITDGGIDCSTASVDNQNQLDISIYPNPTSDVVYIDGNYTLLKAVVYDILGKQVMKESITNNIDISQLEKGVYILQLSDGAKLTTQRIMKN